MKKSKTIIIALIAILGISGGVKLLTSHTSKEQKSVLEEKKEDSTTKENEKEINKEEILQQKKRKFQIK